MLFFSNLTLFLNFKDQEINQEREHYMYILYNIVLYNV